jgi:type IV pilus assembly protein PilA
VRRDNPQIPKTQGVKHLMKSEFQAKYLQHLVSKKKNNEGFTLIELLVVIIIVGVLAAIALPSFLNQIGKARGSEATSNLGTIHRGLQAYRLQNSSFTSVTGLDSLDARVSGKFYDYAVASVDADNATTTARINAGGGATDLKEFDGAVVQITAPDFFGSAICESLSNADGGSIGGATAPIVANDPGGCNTSTSRLVN